MSNQLFTEVSVEQQEIVAGGALAFLDTANFFTKVSSFEAFSVADGNGAASGVKTFTFTDTASFLTALAVD
ncbi:MAG: hypothetical protein EA343_24280 [Nodularia sp. (in: Bacteria)]|nr:MAG: hypothetical protein EA343_24280 [Nodularia sp. (in: cyanobacteria)]